MNIKGVGIGRGVAVGPVIRMAAPLPEPSDAPRAENISAETEIARVEKSLALVNADLNRRACGIFVAGTQDCRLDEYLQNAVALTLRALDA